MKSMILKVLCLLFVLQSCQKDKFQTQSISLPETTVNLPATAIEKMVTVKAVGKWSVTNLDANWCKATPVGDQLKLNLTENDSQDSRSTVITLVAGSATADLTVNQLGQKPDILFVERHDATYLEQNLKVEVVANVNYTVSMPAEADWIERITPDQSKAFTTYKEEFKLLKHLGNEPRTAEIKFIAQAEGIERIMRIVQSNRGENDKPSDPVGFGVKVPVTGAKASQAQNGEGIEFSYDGDHKTFYHSPWYATKFPLELEYFFESEPVDIDYIVYYPRTDSENGHFGEFTIDIKTTANTSSYTTVGTYDLKFKGTPSKISFDEQKKGVTAVRFTVKSGNYNLVTCKEMEFFRNGDPLVGVADVFTDELCTDLKPDVTQEKIDGIENEFFRGIAQSMYNGSYEREFRIQEYEPYRDPADLAKELKTSAYSWFENPTGIHFKKDEEIVVLVGETHGEDVSIKIVNFDDIRKDKSTSVEQVYMLSKGINKIKVAGPAGLSYISYYTPNWQSAGKIKVHIPSGEVNGYFDKVNHNKNSWNERLSKATYGCIDLKGQYVNLVYGVESLKKHCYDGTAMIENYDKIANLEQKMMGLDKYNRRPKNHMFVYVVNSGLFAGGWGVGLQESVMNELAHPVKAGKEGLWCIAHELGHINQIRPGLKWIGTTEITNNIYSVYSRYKFYRENLNLEQEDNDGGGSTWYKGDRFNSYLNNGVVKGDVWMSQAGPDGQHDVFVSLCPLWQLMLYYCEIVEGKSDWFGDLAEIVRTSDQTNLSNGEMQINFIKNTCDVVQEDLTEFFIKAGMLKPVDRMVNDYSNGKLTITQKQCDDVVTYVKNKGYQKPKAMLSYLSANSENAFKNKLPVEGRYNVGVEDAPSGNMKKINHSEWKNVAVFETYSGNTLTNVAIVGTGADTDKDNYTQPYTLVRCPSGSTRIEAVAWDGKRTLVCDLR